MVINDDQQRLFFLCYQNLVHNTLIPHLHLMIGWKVVEDGLWEVFVVNVVLEEETLGAHLYVRVLTEAADDGTG